MTLSAGSLKCAKYFAVFMYIVLLEHSTYCVKAHPHVATTCTAGQRVYFRNFDK